MLLVLRPSVDICNRRLSVLGCTAVVAAWAAVVAMVAFGYAATVVEVDSAVGMYAASAEAACRYLQSPPQRAGLHCSRRRLSRRCSYGRFRLRRHRRRGRFCSRHVCCWCRG